MARSGGPCIKRAARRPPPPQARSGLRHVSAVFPSVALVAGVRIEPQATIPSSAMLLSVTERMRGTDQELHGFEAGDRDIPEPAIDVTPETRERMIQTLYAQIIGATPEEVAEYLQDGFPLGVTVALDCIGVREEMSNHVDLLLSVMQSPPSG